MQQGNKRKIVIAIAAVAAIAVIGVLGYVIYQKLSMDPLAYYRMVEKDARDEQVEGMKLYGEMLEQSLGATGSNQEMDMKLTLSNTAKMMLGLTGVNLDQLDSLSLHGTTGFEEDKQVVQMQILTNEEKILTVNEYLDGGENAIYMQMPELSDAYVKMDLDTQGVGINSISEYREICTKGINNISELYERYTDILLDEIKTVDKKKTTIEAAGVSMDVDCYTVEMKDKDARHTIDKILNQLKEDKDFLELAGITGDTGKDNFLEEIDGMQQELRGEQDEELSIKCQTYIADEQIYGRDLTLKASDDSLVLHSLAPQDDTDFGYLFSVKDKEYEYVTIEGSGTQKKDVLNGEFQIGTSQEAAENFSDAIVDYNNILTIKVKDCDVNALKQGKYSGTYTFSTGAIANLTNYSVRMEASGDIKKAKQKIAVLGGTEEMAVLEIQSKIDDDNSAQFETPKEPIYDTMDAQAMEKYQQEISRNLPSLFLDLKKKSGVDLSPYFLGMAQGQGIFE